MKYHTMTRGGPSTAGRRPTFHRRFNRGGMEMKCGLRKYLGANDMAQMLDLSFQSIHCKDRDHLERLVLALKKLFYFEYAVCAQGNAIELIEAKRPPKLDVFDINYPDGYLALYMKKKIYFNDAIFNEFATNLSPVNWACVDKKCNNQYLASIPALDFNMRDGWTHGTMQPGTLDCSMFFLAGARVDKDVRTARILDYIIPFYSGAFRRILRKETRPVQALTRRELEILKWIKAGKSSWETSVILGCSKRNVDFHVNNIKQKLNAVSRPHIVAIALQNGIIDY
jgi:DNA-binding CsgD family transcriptional regulator